MITNYDFNLQFISDYNIIYMYLHIDGWMQGSGTFITNAPGFIAALHKAIGICPSVFEKFLAVPYLQYLTSVSGVSVTCWEREILKIAKKNGRFPNLPSNKYSICMNLSICFSVFANSLFCHSYNIWSVYFGAFQRIVLNVLWMLHNGEWEFWKKL